MCKRLVTALSRNLHSVNTTACLHSQMKFIAEINALSVEAPACSCLFCITLMAFVGSVITAVHKTFCQIRKRKAMGEKVDLVNFWGESSSHVWKYFGFETELINGEKTVIKDKAVCRECGAKLKYAKSTGNLNNHLKLIHFKVNSEKASV